MKFDAVVGNPPYQKKVEGDNKLHSYPIYPDFMDEAYVLADRVTLITPGRFLFDTGGTPKKWNRKMLSDEHLSVLYYLDSEGSKRVFNGVGIAGGIAITLRDVTKKNGKIGLFLPHDEQKGILSKVSHSLKNGSLKDIAVAPEAYKFTEKMHDDYPLADGYLSNGHKYDLKSNIFTKLDFIFTESRMDDTDICIHGLVNRNRTKKYIKRTYMRVPHNFEDFKLLFPKAGGSSGGYGDKLSNGVVAKPGEGHTQTFLSFGGFDTELEPHNCGKYIKTKFLRSLLGTLKVTQDNPPRVWSNIPLQDYTKDSDIDWSKSIKEIDQQLYKKYGLSEDEINFIETHVKEMD